MEKNTEKTIEKSEEKKQEIPKTQTIETEKTTEAKKSETQNKKIRKKDEAVVNIQNAPISTKYSVSLCKFIKNKQIKKAINELEQVLVYKKAIPMGGGYGHQKSSKKFASGSGKYPQNATKYFIKLLKSLSSNALANGLENPTITGAFANTGQEPRARFGRWERKRTHINLVAKELIKSKNETREHKGKGQIKEKKNK
mgnify:CR=1 FL=1